MDGLIVTAAVQRFQAHAGALQVIEQIAVRNSTPRTGKDDRPLEIQLPPGAQVEATVVQRAGGQPSAEDLVPGGQKGHYLVRGPLRPGETRLQVVYRLPYKGDALIEPKFLYPVERFVVVLPKSMSFEAEVPALFQAVQSKTEDSVRVAAPVRVGQQVAFRVSGKGILAEVRAEQQAAQTREQTRPGGGLGPPTDLPDPLHDYRWPILGGVCVALTLGGVRTVRKPHAARARRA